jgi:hypothetical protein
MACHYNITMKTIPLTKGYFTKVDDEDYEELAKIRWHVTIQKGSERPRACRSVRKNGKKMKNIYMSRVILNPPIGKYVDHVNGDTLDNRKSNLRLATPTENSRNYPRPKTNKSGYKGVSFDKRENKWKACISTNKEKNKHLGYFNTPQEAGVAYNEASLKYHGEYGRINNL